MNKKRLGIALVLLALLAAGTAFAQDIEVGGTFLFNGSSIGIKYNE